MIRGPATRVLPALGVAALMSALVAVLAPPAAATPGPGDAPEYWFDRWRVESLWADGARGQGVTIAEIDTGVNARLPELAGRVLLGTDLGRGGDGHTDREVDAFGHGTAMASIMVARPGLLDITGLAPAARILPIAVPLNGTTDEADPGRLPDAIRYAADHGAGVINMSIGGKQYPDDTPTPCPADEQQAIFYAMDRGAIVVAAAGNTGDDGNAVEEPAACLGVVAVGAVDASDTVADFSTRAPYLSLTAPGVDIPSLGRKAGDAFSGNGTSQAAALVSASLALARSRFPTLSADAIVARLFATLDHRRATPSPSYGYGVLDAGALLRDTVPARAPDPVYAIAAPFRARARTLSAAAPSPPPPAATAPSHSLGAVVTDRRPVARDQVRTGLAVAAVGLLALIALLAYAQRARHRRAARPPPPLP